MTALALAASGVTDARATPVRAGPAIHSRSASHPATRGLTASSRTKPRSAEFVSDRRVAVRWEIARDVTFRRPVQRRRWTAFRHLAEEEVALVLHLADAIYENAPSATAVRQA